jgi:alkyl sulfatase BDS1-like metallo-beta-lactamase superfamily hydrolase
MPIADVFDYLGTRVDGPRARTRGPIVITWRFADSDESLASTLAHGALTSTAGKPAPDAEAGVTTTRPVFEAVVLGQRTLADALDRGAIRVNGNVKAVQDLWSLFVDFQTGVPIVTPAEGK